jgi:alkylation response protein AidB-like acyl-CoA dehydrogenase
MDFELSKEQQDIQKAAREFAVGEFREIARDCDLNEEFPRSLLEKAGDLGFIGVFIDEEYDDACSVDQGKIYHALIAMAKWFSAEMAVRCADEALQMHG